MPCLLLSFIAVTVFVNLPDDRDSPRTEPFVAPKYAVTTQIPIGWRLVVREKDDRVFVAVIAQDDPDRPGIAACELGLAPESLEDYRTRIDSNARQHVQPSGKLASNRVINDARGERLETVREFHPDSGGFWHEDSFRELPGPAPGGTGKAV